MTKFKNRSYKKAPVKNAILESRLWSWVKEDCIKGRKINESEEDDYEDFDPDAERRHQESIDAGNNLDSSGNYIDDGSSSELDIEAKAKQLIDIAADLNNIETGKREKEIINAFVAECILDYLGGQDPDDEYWYKNIIITDDDWDEMETPGFSAKELQNLAQDVAKRWTNPLSESQEDSETFWQVQRQLRKDERERKKAKQQSVNERKMLRNR